MRFVVLATVALILVGCGQQRLYVPPSDGPLATVEFKNEARGLPITVLFYEDGVTCKGLVRASFYSQDFAGSSVTVSAGKPFTFTIDHSTGRRYCRQTFMFTPDQGAYRVVTTTGSEQCALVVEKSVKTDGSAETWVPVTEITRRQYKAPFFQDGEWCEPL
ncbi:hypothetical protein [Ahniella affigens]|nr:hypothetical protein [Ahniella affigens]